MVGMRAAALLQLLDEAEPLGVLVDVHPPVGDAVLGEELLGPLAVGAPGCPVDGDDLGHPQLPHECRPAPTFRTVCAIALQRPATAPGPGPALAPGAVRKAPIHCSQRAFSDCSAKDRAGASRLPDRVGAGPHDCDAGLRADCQLESLAEVFGADPDRRWPPPAQVPPSTPVTDSRQDVSIFSQRPCDDAAVEWPRPASSERLTGTRRPGKQSSEDPAQSAARATRGERGLRWPPRPRPASAPASSHC